MKKRRIPLTRYTVSTKRGEARVEKTGIAKGEPFGINKAIRRNKRKAGGTN